MANMRTACLLVFASMSASMSAATFGADIFKWVDEKGRIQYGESVPAKYAKSATKIDPGEIQPQATEAQRQEAAASAAKDKADAQSLTSRTENTDKPSRSVSASTDNSTAQCEAERKNSAIARPASSSTERLRARSCPKRSSTVSRSRSPRVER